MASRRRQRKDKRKARKSPKLAQSPSVEKRPHLRFHPEASKAPRAVEGRDFYQSHPRWRFALLRMGGPYGWTGLSVKDARKLHEKLRHLERQVWQEIFVRSKKQNHSVTTDQLSADAKKDLRQYKLDDRDELWTLRITGERRLWGVLQEDVFYILWWDPNHEVCPSPKRHT